MSKPEIKVKTEPIKEEEESEEVLVEMDLPVVAKRARYTFQQKMQILEDLKALTPIKTSRKYNINERTLRKWKQDENAIKEASTKENLKNCKRKQCTLKFDDALHNWYIDAVSKGDLVTGAILKRQAIIINRDMKGDTDFKASNGWLEKWKSRKNVKLPLNSMKASRTTKCTAVEELSPTDKIKAEFAHMLRMRGLERSQIFSLEENILQFTMKPKKSSTPKSSEKQMDEMTITGCCNADGSLSLPLIAIGKLEKPLCFKNLKHYQMPVWYRSQENSIMDYRIFEEWFTEEFVPKVETFLISKNLPLSAILFVENCEPYKDMPINKVNQIEIRFFPKDITSLEHLLD